MLLKIFLLISLVSLAVGFSSKGLKVPQNPDGHVPPSRRTVSKVQQPAKGLDHPDVKGIQQQHQQHQQQDETKGELRAMASEDQPDFNAGFDSEDESGHDDGSTHDGYEEAPVPIHNEALLRSGEEHLSAPVQHPVKGIPQQQEEAKGYPQAPAHGIKTVQQQQYDTKSHHVPPVKGLKRPSVKGHHHPVKGYPQQQEEVKGIPQAPAQLPDVKGYPQHPEVKSPPQQETKTVQQQYDTKSAPLPPVKGKRMPLPRRNPVKGIQLPQVPQVYDQSPYLRRPAVTLLRTPHGFEHSEGLAVVVESRAPLAHSQVQEPQVQLPQEPQVHVPQEPQAPLPQEPQEPQNPDY